MGKRFTVFDDMDDKLDADRTVPFVYDGVAYEIDLNQKNIDKLDAALTPFIGAARRTGRAPAKTQARTHAKAPASQDRDAVRHWAGKNGFRVSDKGRIPQAVQEAFDAAHIPVIKAETATKADPTFSAK